MVLCLFDDSRGVISPGKVSRDCSTQESEGVHPLHAVIPGYIYIGICTKCPLCSHQSLLVAQPRREPVSLDIIETQQSRISVSFDEYFHLIHFVSQGSGIGEGHAWERRFVRILPQFH